MQCTHLRLQAQGPMHALDSMHSTSSLQAFQWLLHALDFLRGLRSFGFGCSHGFPDGLEGHARGGV